MRNVKVKAIKRIALLSLAVFMLSSGATFAADNWSSFQTEAQNGTVNLEGDQPIETGGQGYNLGAPPVPALTINGNGHTIQGDSTQSANNFIINNQNNNLEIHNTNFTGANVLGEGGAIQNGTVSQTDNSSGDIRVDGGDGGRSSFTSNTAGKGGAIYHEGTGSVVIEDTDFTSNVAETQTGGERPESSGIGGAIFNQAADVLDIPNFTITGSNFSENTASNYGGAIANFNGNMSIVNSEFSNNELTSSTGDGGAIVNRSTMEISDSLFSGNYASSSGGAIINGLSNSQVQGREQDAILTISNTTFDGNHAGSSGGAIINMGNTGYTNTLTINGGTTFSNNYVRTDNPDPTTAFSSSVGGAILNAAKVSGGTDPILKIQGSANNTVKFENNLAGSGGAIANRGEAVINYAEFTNNGHNDSIEPGYTTAFGGAIYNRQEEVLTGTEYSAGTISVSNSKFENNIAGQGGAIYNSNGTVTVVDSNFTGNKTTSGLSSDGGAVYGAAGSSTTLKAQNTNMTVGTDTSAVDGSDSIALAGTGTSADSNIVAATLNLEAANGRNLIINSNITGNDVVSGDATPVVSNRSIINIGEKGSQSLGGTVRVNGDAKITSSTINVNSGELSFRHDSGLSSDGSNVINMNGGLLNMLNGELVNQIQGREFNMLSNSSIKLDVDLANETMDSILKSNFGTITNDNDSLLTIAGMKSRSDALKDDVKILFTDADPLIGNVNLGQGANVVEGLTHKYSVSQVTQTGTGADGTPAGEYFIFNEMGNSDSSLVGAVAAQGAFLVMDNLYRQSFANMDMVTLMTPEQRMAWKMRNKYANAGYHTGVYAPNVIPEERDGWYMRPFTNFENVPLKGGPKVSNVSYGSLFGGESDIIELGHGWDGNFSLFGAYHGSHQAYNGVSIWQNGGTIGGVATAYKGNFFTGVTANIGASAARATHAFGTDDFPILMTGAAWKSGYNWGLFNRKLIIQPSYMMSYTFVNVFDFTNAGGARITQDPLHAIEIIPGIRIIGNLKNGWQPYLGVNMTWNIMDKTKFYANEVALSQLSVKPYIEYGVGLQKRYGDRFTGFGQAMIRNGGRNGIAFTLGLRWALGH